MSNYAVIATNGLGKYKEEAEKLVSGIYKAKLFSNGDILVPRSEISHVKGFLKPREISYRLF